MRDRLERMRLLFPQKVFVLDAHHFLRDALFDELSKDPTACWHRPIVIRDMKARLGNVIGRMQVVQENPEDDLIETPEPL